MTTLELAIVGFIALTGLLIAAFRDLIGAIAVFGAFSLGVAIAWLLLDAPDVALTEAAVGTGVMTLLFLIAAMKTRHRPIRPDEPEPDQDREPIGGREWMAPLDWGALLAAGTVIGALGMSIRPFPEIGDPAAPAVAMTDPAGRTSAYAYMVGDAGPVVEFPNTVAAVLTVYRNLDTLGEVVVAFSAGVGLLIVLDRPSFLSADGGDQEDGASLAPPPAPYVMGPVVTTAVRLVIPVVFGFGVYLVVQGTWLPGGGFSGGVIVGAAVILLLLGFGIGPTSAWISNGWLLGGVALGVWSFIVIAVAPLAYGGGVLEVIDGPIDPILVAEAIEIAIGVLVGTIIAAITLALAIGYSDSTREKSTEEP